VVDNLNVFEMIKEKSEIFFYKKGEEYEFVHKRK
jgi:hypothetical protein